MFNRRVVSSCGIPRSMWQSMHIMSRCQASHVLPPFVPLLSVSTSATAQLQLVLGEPSSLSSLADMETNSLMVLGVAERCAMLSIFPTLSKDGGGLIFQSARRISFL